MTGMSPVAVITIIDDERRSLVFHPDVKVVHHKIKGTISGTDLRDLLSRGADCLERNRATKWLSDDRLNGVIFSEDYKWAEEVWAPRVIKAGFKHWAIAVPTNALGSMQMRRFAKEYRERGVTVAVFDEPDTALAWLVAAK